MFGMELAMSVVTRHPAPVAGLAVIVALAAHGPAAAQVGARTTLAVASTDPRTSGEPDPAPDRVAVPFAGTYQVTLALGRDTVDLFIRTAAEAELSTVIAPTGRGQHGLGAAVIPGLLLPVFADPDSSALPSILDDQALPGSLVAAMDPTAGSGRSWPITLLAGVDTSGATPAARLSRLLLAVRSEREALELRCREDPQAANKAARRSDEDEVCDEESGLPLAQRGVPGDGILVLSPDDRVRIEQRVETRDGELTMWGRRVSRVTLQRAPPSF
jgi:hypothetical protein